MKLDKLFQVLVVMGASTAGLTACGDDDGDEDGGGGTSGSGGSTATGGSATTGGTGGTAGAGGTGGTAGAGAAGGDACEAICEVSSADPGGPEPWIDCGGCCCWLPPGSPHTTGSPICGEEPCCEGRGR